ncbi:MAG TPA: hypothetical protein VFS55_16700 [Dokdonella sp.]|nr:hypothetical protein [Dokdonella sp.]
MDDRHDSLAARVFGLCLLRTAPQDLPHAPGLLAAFVVAGIVLAGVAGAMLGDVAGALAQSLLAAAVVLGLCWAALALRRLRNRYVQTATALFACDVAFTCVQIPLLLLASPPPATPAELTGVQVLVGWLVIALFAWQLGVNAHIMRHALDASFGFALVLVATWAVAGWSLSRLLLGG